MCPHKVTTIKIIAKKNCIKNARAVSSYYALRRLEMGNYDGQRHNFGERLRGNIEDIDDNDVTEVD